jgi:hypothetical protein
MAHEAMLEQRVTPSRFVGLLHFPCSAIPTDAHITLLLSMEDDGDPQSGMVSKHQSICTMLLGRTEPWYVKYLPSGDIVIPG